MPLILPRRFFPSPAVFSGAAAPAGTTWDPANSSAQPSKLTLTNSNRTATLVATDDAYHVISVGSSTSKVCYEVVLNVIPTNSAFMVVGFATTPAYSLSTSGSCGIQYGNRFEASGSGDADTNLWSGSWVNGDVITLLVDQPNAKFWACRNGSGVWNNNGSADPASDPSVGGMALTGVTGPIYAWIMFQVDAGTQVTANFAVADFAYPGIIPSGFNPFPAS